MRADRPVMAGYGIDSDEEGLLPWAWARQRLEHAHNYWIATAGGAESVVVRGVARIAREPQTPTAAYRVKYGEGYPDRLWEVRPKTVIAVVEESFTTSATRWTFDD